MGHTGVRIPLRPAAVWIGSDTVHDDFRSTSYIPALPKSTERFRAGSSGNLAPWWHPLLSPPVTKRTGVTVCCSGIRRPQACLVRVPYGKFAVHDQCNQYVIRRMSPQTFEQEVILAQCWGGCRNQSSRRPLNECAMHSVVGSTVNVAIESV